LNKNTLLYTGLGLVYVFLIVGFVFFKTDPRAEELNTLLAKNTELNAYPYQFRVLKVEEDTAVTTSPRSSQVSVLHALPLIYPQLALKSPDSPEMIKAQKELAHYQEIAANLIREQADINTIRWQIDKAWFAQHRVDVERLCDLHNRQSQMQ
jgi:hypothetical protein